MDKFRTNKFYRLWGIWFSTWKTTFHEKDLFQKVKEETRIILNKELTSNTDNAVDGLLTQIYRLSSGSNILTDLDMDAIRFLASLFQQHKPLTRTGTPPSKFVTALCQWDRTATAGAGSCAKKCAELEDHEIKRCAASWTSCKQPENAWIVFLLANLLKKFTNYHDEFLEKEVLELLYKGRSIREALRRRGLPVPNCES